MANKLQKTLLKMKFEQIYRKVIANLESNLPPWLYYHSPEHTKYVLERATFLAGKEGVIGRQLFLIKVAALYHDLGFIKGRDDHERKSCEIAAKELPEYGISPEENQQICNMIMATRIPQNPQTLSEKILADADLEYLGTEHFPEVSEYLYQELLHEKPHLSRQEWNEIQIKFLQQHSFHTSYCKTYCAAIKEKHLQALIKKVKKGPCSKSP